MKPVTRFRIAVITIITLLSLYLVTPTALYYMHLRSKPAIEGVEPLTETPQPPAIETEAYANWRAAHPDFVAWEEKNTTYLTWREKSNNLREKAIPLGLDLLGGADVTLVIDRDQLMINKVDEAINAVTDGFENQKIGAGVERGAKPGELQIRLENPTDARNALNLIGGDNFSRRFASVPSESDLAAGPVTLALNEEMFKSEYKASLEGVLKGISERVDGLGVTQPRISLEGEEKIRIQVPGVENPKRLIQTVIKPAQLEFRMVHENNHTLAPGGVVAPGTALPPGTELVDYKFGDLDPKTKKLTYTTGKMVVMKTKYLTGDMLRSARVLFLPQELTNQTQVSLEFNEKGTEAFANLTTKYANSQRSLAIMLDGVVRSAPTINDPIREGHATISGGFTQEEATELTQILNAGSLQAPLKVESEQSVGSTVGADSIASGVKALALGTLFVVVFMILYYRTAGVIAIIALVMNVLILLAMMQLSKATLTLSGIGGILLTIGMAVDTNVLIYERIREEILSGKPLRQAIAVGFNLAFVVILDSHLTTLLTAMVLLQFTDGSVFGFALTMTFGLLANLYTGLTVTYALCVLYYTKFNKLNVGTQFKFLTGNTIDFIGKRFTSAGISAAILIIPMIFVMMNGGLKKGVDFAGGFRSQVEFAQPQLEDSVREKLVAAGFEDPRVQKVLNTDKNAYILEVLLKKNEADKPDLALTQQAFDDTLAKEFAGTEPNVTLREGFGSQTGLEFTTLAIMVTLLSSIAILVYLSFRFERVFGIAAVLALVHDLTIVVLLITIWKVQISLDVVAALMVLLGYSVNDTIVIFDRIRENARLMPGKTFREICNVSMNQSLGRTFSTGLCVLLAIVTLLWLGGEGLEPFGKVIFLGILVGTYSSIFVATPIVYEINRRTGGRVLRTLTSTRKKKELAKPVTTRSAPREA